VRENVKIDLHCHTTASDGIYTPQALIDLAMQQNVQTIAITDHDTIDGIESALTYAGQKSFRLVPGIEFSVEHPRGAFHLVGLYIDHKNPDLLDKINELHVYRDHRIIHIVDDLQKHNISISLDEVMEEAQGGAVGKPHVARVMIRHGYATTVTEIFEKYLTNGKPGDIPKQRINVDLALQLIKGAGGVAILAHPSSLEYESITQFEEFLLILLEKGIQGIEVYASMHDDTLVAAYQSLAKKYNLLLSGGSDFHGDKGETLGYYGHGRPIPPQLIHLLDAYHQRVQI
jgi:3',5'-nucleoside bisphosphate phosphatase